MVNSSSRKKMTPKQQRMWLVGGGMVSLIAAIVILLTTFSDSLVFFYSATDVHSKPVPMDKRIRVGGMVKEGSVSKASDNLNMTFTLTDYQHDIIVSFTGIPPLLFREKQGIVAEGFLLKDKSFKADNLLAKHDENYMPPEVKKSLKHEHKDVDNYNKSDSEIVPEQGLDQDPHKEIMLQME